MKSLIRFGCCLAGLGCCLMVLGVALPFVAIPVAVLCCQPKSNFEKFAIEEADEKARAERAEKARLFAGLEDAERENYKYAKMALRDSLPTNLPPPLFVKPSGEKVWSTMSKATIQPVPVKIALQPNPAPAIGQAVEIHTKSGGKWTGKLLKLNPDSVAIKWGKYSTSVKKTQMNETSQKVFWTDSYNQGDMR